MIGEKEGGGSSGMEEKMEGKGEEDQYMEKGCRKKTKKRKKVKEMFAKSRGDDGEAEGKHGSCEEGSG